ncbi:MAG: hypothetical protein KAJ15_07665 [Spirochaetes bacterium]|nr:hypothetical protein [Spirochaetota bacterium]
MKNNILEIDKKYEGSYVALKPFDLDSVIASASTSTQVLEEAHKKGFKDPIIMWISSTKMTSYQCR